MAKMKRVRVSLDEAKPKKKRFVPKRKIAPPPEPEPEPVPEPGAKPHAQCCQCFKKLYTPNQPYAEKQGWVRFRPLHWYCHSCWKIYVSSMRSNARNMCGQVDDFTRRVVAASNNQGKIDFENRTFLLCMHYLSDALRFFHNFKESQK